jgi:hypothetical protein
MRTTPENQKLLDLIEDARTGKVVLPVFQRNFVWSRDEITALLVSILEGHYIGSLLLLNIDSEAIPFAYRPLQGVELESKAKPYAMILDGQQRLTSLHYAFAAPNIPLRWTVKPYRFFLDLQKVTAGDIENAVLSERSDNCGGMLDPEQQYKTLVVPLTAIDRWIDWQNQYEQWLVERDKDAYFNQYFKQDKPAWTRMMERMRSYQVPTISLPRINPGDSEGLAEVCTIFEKINSTGVKLSVYDLLTARLYKDKIDLHELWERAVDDHHLLDVYSEGTPNEFGVYVLRTIALMRGMEVRSKTLINLKPAQFKQDWTSAVAYMEKALGRMTKVTTDGFGAFDRKWLPYTTMVSTLAAILWYIEKNKVGDPGYRLMKRWYWSSVFTERYAVSVESTIMRDFQDFGKAVADPEYEMEALRDARTSIVDNKAFTLTNVSRVNSLYRGVICLIALRGARDFMANDAIQFHELEDHHLFPQAFLKDCKKPDGKPFDSNEVNCVVNRTLIVDDTNLKISKRSPSDYVVNLIPRDHRKEILTSHFIEEAAQHAMLGDDYDAFLRARNRILVAEIIKRISA